jgi:hypothetical protein
MNEIEMGPHPASSRHRVVTGVVVLALALIVGSVAVIAGRGGTKGNSALPLLPAGATASASAASAGKPAVAQMYAQPTSYRLKGTLPALAPQAAAYRLDAGLTEAAVAKLARALGLRGAVTTTTTGWTVSDGLRRLEVARDNGGQWSYTGGVGNSCVGISTAVGSSGGAGINGRATIVCSGSVGVASAGGSGGGQAAGGSASVGAPTTANGSQAAQAPTTTALAPSPPVKGAPLNVPPIGSCLMPPCPPGAACPQTCAPGPPPVPSFKPRVPDLPSSQEAERVARDLLAKAGVDLRGADVKVIVLPTSDLVTVNPAVDGVPTTGMEFSVTLGAKSVVDYASGPLAGPSKLGVYPLVGTAQGFKRLQSGQWLAPGGIGPMLGAPQLAPSRVVTITGVHLALIRVAGAGRRSYLAPAYVFETAAPNINPSVPAVADRLLQIAPLGGPRILTPTPMPAPGPAGSPQPVPQVPAVNGGQGPTTAPAPSP